MHYAVNKTRGKGIRLKQAQPSLGLKSIAFFQASNRDDEDIQHRQSYCV